MGKEDREMDTERHEEVEEKEEKEALADDEGNELEESNSQDEEEEKTLEELKEENKTLSDKMMRALAETENIRKRFFKEKKDAEIYGGTKLARDLLSVLDNLNRALESIDDEMRQSQNAFLEGIELTKKRIVKYLFKPRNRRTGS